MITWKSLSIFGNSQLINRSYIYLFIVPVFAKLLSKMKSPLTFEIDSIEYTLILELPFSWAMFFLSAFLFTIASLIYFYGAPSIIKENKSFGTFLIDRKNAQHISNYAIEIGITREWFLGLGMKNHEDIHSTKLFDYLKNRSEKLKEETVIDHEEIEKIENQKKLEVYEEVHREPEHDEEDEQYMQSKFWTVYNYANFSKRALRITCALLYGFGLASIFIVVLQGAKSVFEMWFFK